MHLLDEQYTRAPHYGIRRMTAWLCAAGYAVNHKRVARTIRQMGLHAIDPKMHRKFKLRDQVFSRLPSQL